MSLVPRLPVIIDTFLMNEILESKFHKLKLSKKFLISNRSNPKQTYTRLHSVLALQRDATNQWYAIAVASTNISTDCYWAVCFHFLISCILHSSAWASLADNQTCTALHCTDRTYVVRPMSHKQLLKPTKLCSLQKAVVFILIAFIGARSGTLCLQDCVYFYIFISPAILSKNSRSN